jgi:hypothetical protein
MKIRNITWIVGCLMLFFACSDQLNYNEYVGYNKDQIFSSFDRTMNFVTNIYSYLDYDFGNYDGAMLASACDEAEYAWTSSSIHDFYNGSWSPTNPKSGVWSSSYAAIRAANLYLEASKGQTFSDFKYNKDYGDQMARFNRYQYEVRFLRAYFYFNLVRQYGDVPFTDKVLSETEANSLSRTSADAIFKFIVSECDDIVNQLPVSYGNLPYKETGRVTRGAVLALKARALLYRASPLFNSNNDKLLWKEAALANKAVIDSCASYGIKLGTYSALWGTDNYNAGEMIFVRRIGDLNSLEANNFPIGVEGGKSGNCPTQTLVDAYGMKPTGKLWNEENSGYDPNKPYDNRDPRFGFTIAKNGDKGWPTYNQLPLQTYEGGANGYPIPGATPTGYYLKKYLDPSVDLRPNYTNTKRHSWITFRLGEFYLNYAEAVFNYLGSADATDNIFTLSARDAVNVIRQRSDVGMPKLPTGLSNDDFLKKYKNERMVELAFEGHRFWDIRRWKDGNVLRSITLMKITKIGDNNFTYTRLERKRLWDDKMYFFPIPDAEIRKNSNLTQNPGW